MPIRCARVAGRLFRRRRHPARAEGEDSLFPDRDARPPARRRGEPGGGQQPALLHGFRRCRIPLHYRYLQSRPGQLAGGNPDLDREDYLPRLCLHLCEYRDDGFGKQLDRTLLYERCLPEKFSGRAGAQYRMVDVRAADGGYAASRHNKRDGRCVTWLPARAMPSRCI